MALDLSVYLVIGARDAGPRGVRATVEAAVAGGVSVVQLRDKQASGRELMALAAQLLDLLDGTGVPLLLNDRLDIALASGAHGVHLGQSDLDVRRARRLAGPEFVIGLSASRPEEVADVHSLPSGTVDYLGIGPVFPTATKPDARAAVGLAALAELCAGTALPCVGIGGITARNAAAVWAAGVDGLAVVSAITGAPNPRAAAAGLRGARP
ncbi:MAG TPA: thiamine phosphate synthase [Cellulomonas sp.]|uniref:thiamine phosphate synthase n=1 Tax=Cellulomonas sp. TaxID=40001 RepID=UPI002E3014BA|nr:thiamine phosphate synthase [Cellulomonas sp.]HEX5333411.1 thiamine phosphate synthase [Cellulomonas sp.]